MNRLNDYTHKEIWSRRGENFLIEVVRWEKMTQEKYEELRKTIDLIDGRFVWNVYCYIYPKHRLFNDCENEDMCDCPINNFHCGCTFANWHIKADGTITAKQYGSDYNHYQDERFTYIEKPEDAYVIFNDADELFEELS